MRHPELVRRLAEVGGFEAPRADLEQVRTPPEAAAVLLESADAAGDLGGRSVLDLGSGTGTLAIGAALLGAASVVGIEIDPRARARAVAAAERAGARVEFVTASVATWDRPADTVLMNPPFGAQRKRADRPFWERAFALARRAVYSFALADSRSFIAGRAVARHAYVETVRPVPWELERSFPHHRRDRVAIPVDLWVIRTEPNQ